MSSFAMVASKRSAARNRISTCQMNLFATRTPSTYEPLLTYSSMSEMHEADDSSKVERTLHMRYTFSSMRSSSCLTSSRVVASSRAMAALSASFDGVSLTFQNLWIM